MPDLAARPRDGHSYRARNRKTRRQHSQGRGIDHNDPPRRKGRGPHNRKAKPHQQGNKIHGAPNEKGSPKRRPPSRNPQGLGVNAVFQRLGDGELDLLVSSLGHAFAGGGVANLTLGACAARHFAKARQGDCAASGHFARHNSRDRIQRCCCGLFVRAHGFCQSGDQLGLCHRFVHGTVPLV